MQATEHQSPAAPALASVACDAWKDTQRQARDAAGRPAEYWRDIWIDGWTVPPIELSDCRRWAAAVGAVCAGAKP